VLRFPPLRGATHEVEDTQTSGKRQEFMAIATPLARGCDVDLTLVDNQQIDCIVREDRDGDPVCYDVQMRARSRKTQMLSRATCSRG